MRYILILSILFLLISCGDDPKESSTSCGNVQDCDSGYECKFSSLTAEKGSCVATQTCVIDSDCDDGRICGEDRSQQKVCGGTLVSFMLIGSGDLPSAMINTEYSYQLPIDGVSGPFFIQVKTGNLPAGLSIEPTTGIISGTPTATGSYTFTLEAINGTLNSNAYYNVVKTEKTYTIFVGMECEAGYIDDGEGNCVVNVDRELEAGDLIITEFMANPTGNDGGKEWVEIYNPTNVVVGFRAINFKVVSVSSSGTTEKDFDLEAPVETTFVIEPGEYFIIAGENAYGENVIDHASVLPEADAKSDLNLYNSADSALRIVFKETVLDQVSYTVAAEDGISFQLDPSKYDQGSNDIWGNWCAGTDTISNDNPQLGTPKGANNSCEGVSSCNPNPCNEANRTVCNELDGGFECLCDEGFVEDENGACVEDPSSPCYNNPCSGNVAEHKTVCVVEGENYVCNCDAGYYEEGGVCIEGTTCNPNPCTDTNKTVCNDLGEGNYSCSCDEGFVDDGEGNCIMPLSEGDLIITEFMPNPASVGDSEGEWIEIYNTTDQIIDLTGRLVIVKGTTEDNVEGDGFLMIMPQSHFVIANSDAPNLIYDAISGFSLTNSGATISIKVDGTTIDSVTYATSADGASWQLDPTFYSAEGNDSMDNWCYGTVAVSESNSDLGTPGSMNNSCGAVNPCDPNPCVETNKTVCNPDGESYTCSCDAGYSDDGSGNCIEDINNPCDPNPCTETNKEVCTPDGESYICSCNEGFVDDGSGNCIENVTDPCDPNPCTDTNKTVCTADGDNYTCSCDLGYIDDGSGNCIENVVSGLFITEVAPNWENVEFIEIYNSTGGSVDLSQYSIAIDESGGMNTIAILDHGAGTILANNSYAVIVESDYSSELSTGSALVVHVDDTTLGTSGLTKSEDVYLKLGDTVIDSYTYDFIATAAMNYSAQRVDFTDQYCEATPTPGSDNVCE